MNEPTTEAGRALMADEWLVTPYGEANEAVRKAVLAIEAEAAAKAARTERIRIRAVVLALESDCMEHDCEDGFERATGRSCGHRESVEMTFLLTLGVIGMGFLFLCWLLEAVWAAGNAHGYDRGRRDERRFGR